MVSGGRYAPESLLENLNELQETLNNTFKDRGGIIETVYNRIVYGLIFTYTN